MSNQTTPISTPYLFPTKPKPQTRTAWQVMWREKYSTTRRWLRPAPWTPLETEVWDKPEWAEARLKHYQKLSLSRVLEFRVEAVEMEAS